MSEQQCPRCGAEIKTTREDSTTFTCGHTQFNDGGECRSYGCVVNQLTRALAERDEARADAEKLRNIINKVASGTPPSSHLVEYLMASDESCRLFLEELGKIHQERLARARDDKLIAERETPSA